MKQKGLKGDEWVEKTVLDGLDLRKSGIFCE